MPRLRQVPRDEVTDPLTLAMYDHLFADRCPVAEPGTADGTTGDWWTVMALSPAVLEHEVAGFMLYQDPARKIDPVRREVAQCRVGVATRSTFVAEQHRLALERLGVAQDQVDAIVTAASLDVLDPELRRVVDFVDHLVAGLGAVPDDIFDPLADELGDEAMLELTYITCTYLLHSVMSRVLRTEGDAAAGR